MRVIAAFVGGLFALVGVAVFLWVFTAVDETPLREAVETRAVTPYLGGTESRVLTSSITGREYQISVALPLGYEESTERYPVLYGVDANGQYGTLVETARILRLGDQIPPLIIVGVGYPVGGWQINARRKRFLDLTPTEDPTFLERARQFPPTPEGQGDAPGFLRFIREELIPLVEGEYRAAPEDRTLYGHSAGGLFAVHALLHGERTFRGFIIASPALYWDSRVIFAHEASYSEANRSLEARIFFSAGDLEDEERILAPLQDFLEILEERRYDGLVWASKVFEDENHQSVLPGTISRGLRYIYGEQ